MNQSDKLYKYLQLTENHSDIDIFMDIFVDITKSNIPEIIKKAGDNKEMNLESNGGPGMTRTSDLYFIRVAL